MIRSFLLFFWLVALTPAEVVDKAGALFDEQHWRETVDVINENLPALRQSGDAENLASGDAGNISFSLNTLAGICLAMENYEEGERLSLSPRTVEAHKNNIFRKLGIGSTAELVELMSKRDAR